MDRCDFGICMTIFAVGILVGVGVAQIWCAEIRRRSAALAKEAKELRVLAIGAISEITREERLLQRMRQLNGIHRTI